ncbi:MAG: trypsin-like peptidase domain-containing protein [Mycolicibacterium sp.]|uniref:trypsin-like peptidase domain-containing protein n=1 Tax=Mycolicibacterium sp. TaxID=2320850 RepID=UPI003D105348
MAYVEVQDATGGIRVGSAFHVGEGVFVTARQVVENGNVLEVGSTEASYVPVDELDESSTFVVVNGVKQPVHEVRNNVMTLQCGPYFHPDDAVDVAVFRVKKIDPLTPVIPLGGHLDDWLGESDFVLTEAVILGYPPIPKAKRASLIGTHAEVNAMIDRCDTPHVHFVLSAMARGDFSGGPVLSVGEYGYALGMVTSLTAPGSHPAELGYMAAIGVEPLYACLAEHMLLPDCQADGWDDLWNT